MANLTEILESSLFIWGLVVGAVCLVLVLVVAMIRRGEAPLPFGGVLLAGATLVAWSLGGEHSGAAWVGVGAVVGLTAAVALAGGRPWMVCLASFPGAVVLANTVPEEPLWFRGTVLVVVPVAGFLVDEFDTRYRHLGLGVLFYGLACLGSFLAVPDTELPRALMAAAFPLMFASWPKALVNLGRVGAYAAVSVFVFSTVTGGVGREASVIGALACLGLLILEPVVVRLRHRLARLPAWLHETPEAALLATIPQVVLVFVASRVAGLMVSIKGAAVTVLVLFGVFTLMLIWVERTRIPHLGDEPGTG